MKWPQPQPGYDSFPADAHERCRQDLAFSAIETKVLGLFVLYTSQNMSETILVTREPDTPIGVAVLGDHFPRVAAKRVDAGLYYVTASR